MLIDCFFAEIVFAEMATAWTGHLPMKAAEGMVRDTLARID